MGREAEPAGELPEACRMIRWLKGFLILAAGLWAAYAVMVYTWFASFHDLFGTSELLTPWGIVRSAAVAFVPLALAIGIARRRWSRQISN